MHIPLIESDGILDKQQRLLRQERRAQCGSEIELVQEHSGHLRVESSWPLQAVGRLAVRIHQADHRH